MAEVEWIKIKVDIFNDEKIRLIEALPEGDTLIVIWMKMLAHAGKINDRGYIYLKEGTPYNSQMLSIVYNRPQTIIDLALQTFSDFGMIEISERGIYIVNWEKHQNIDGLEKIRQQNRERKRKQRERERLAALPSGSDDEQKKESRDSHVTVTQSHATDKEKDKEKDKDQPKGRSINQYSEEFEEFWSIYPRKVGKKRAYDLWKRRLTVRNQELKAQPEELIKAAQNYANHCEMNGTETKYIKHPSTFLSDKLDYLDWIDYQPQAKFSVIPGGQDRRMRNDLDYIEKLLQGG